MMMDWIQQINSPVGSLGFLRDWFNAQLIFSMCQHVAIIFVIAFLFSKSTAFELLVKNTLRKRDWMVLYAIFFSISTMGSIIADQVTIQSVESHWAKPVVTKIEPALFAENSSKTLLIATTQVDARAIGTVLAGLLGGPLLGASVGISTGAVRYWMGGDAALAGAIGTALAGLVAGLIYLLVLRVRPSMRFNWKVAFFTVCLVEIIMKCLVFITNPPLAKGLAMIQVTAIPNTLGNGIGTALFVSILNDYDKTAASFSTNALRMAEFFAKVLKRDLPAQRKAARIARFIQKETGIAAVAITDQTKLIAFDGMGIAHHHVGDVMATGLVKKAIETNKIIFIDGYNHHFRCKKSQSCPLHSALIAPVVVSEEVEGALLLFEPKHRFFPKMNHELGKGLASLLSEQILASRYPELLARAEDQYLRTRVDPHFFANALTTISAISRKDAGEARSLMRKLASLMRERIDSEQGGNTLKQELAFLNDYIAIEKARFGNQLQIELNTDTSLLDMVVPRFVLQLLVENAIKHGVSKLLDTGHIEVNVYRTEGELVCIDVKDNAGLFFDNEAANRGGYGMKLVDDLIKTQFNSNEYGLIVNCEPDQYTTVTVTFPYVVENVDSDNEE
jgi:two-component system LytT family sensor kinase